MNSISVLIKLDNVSKSINNKRIIKGESFSINEGRIIALLGPNGAGKTTTVRLITGLLSVDSGSIKFNGKNLSGGTKEFRKYISVLNDGNLYEDLSLIENLRIWKELYGISNNDFQERISPLLAFFSLEDRKNDKVETFSKGMKQKAAIIRAMINNPKLLILDEPTSGLDPESIEELYQLLEEIKSNRKLSIILCTHQLYGIEKIVDDIIVLRKGEVLLKGSVDGLVSKYWPMKEYKLNVKQTQKAYKEINSLKIKCFSKHDALYFTVKYKDEVSKIIKKLVECNINIYSIKEISKGVRDLYFKFIGEDKL